MGGLYIFGVEVMKVENCPFCGNGCTLESEVFWPEAESLDMYRVECGSLTCEYQSGFSSDEGDAVSSHNTITKQAARIAEVEAGIAAHHAEITRECPPSTLFKNDYSLWNLINKGDE